MKRQNVSKSKKIKIVLTDVDGVLTDGGMYYSDKGDTLKKFHAKDGMGVNILLRNKIPTVIVTKEKNAVIRKWGKKMNVALILDGIITQRLMDAAKQSGIEYIVGHRIANLSNHDGVTLKTFTELGIS